jgi:DNA-binding response OmpR family regulator
VSGPTASDAWRDPSAASRPRIVIVDDDRDITALVAAWLCDIADIHTATTSAQAYTLTNVVQPDLAIIDVILPRTDGFELVDALRRNPHLAATPVIFITGSDRADIHIRAVDVGAAAVLYKPLQEEVLREAVLTLLRPRTEAT